LAREGLKTKGWKQKLLAETGSNDILFVRVTQRPNGGKKGTGSGGGVKRTGDGARQGQLVGICNGDPDSRGFPGYTHGAEEEKVFRRGKTCFRAGV